MEENRPYQIKCSHCDHEFTEEFEGHNTTTDACCPKCGNFTKLEFDAQGNMVSDDQEEVQSKEEKQEVRREGVREILKEQLELLAQINSTLANTYCAGSHISHYEIIQKNTLAMCEIVKMLDSLKPNCSVQIRTNIPDTTKIAEPLRDAMEMAHRNNSNN